MDSEERLRYDFGSLKKSIQESEAVGKYMLSPDYAYNKNQCFTNDVGYIGYIGGSLSVDRPLIDVSSDLHALQYRNTKDPNKKYQMPSHLPEQYKLKICSPRTDFSRLTVPLSTMRDTGINRFEPLPLNPQSPNRIFLPVDVDMQNRMVIKDNYIPHIREPIDHSRANVF